MVRHGWQIRTDVSEGRIASLITVTLMMKAIRLSETSVLTRARRRNIPEVGTLHSRYIDCAMAAPGEMFTLMSTGILTLMTPKYCLRFRSLSLSRYMSARASS
jgi:hypothetical protein